MKKLDASNSQTDSFRRCERAHWYSYGLQIQPKKPSIALVRGIVGHTALAEYYMSLRDGMGHIEAKKNARQMLMDQIDEYPLYDQMALKIELGNVLQAYFTTFEPEVDKVEIVGVEQEFKVRITDDFELPFIVDLIIRHPDYGLEAWDHKFVWDFMTDKVQDLNPQLPLYYAGMRMLGYEHFGVRYNQLRYRDTNENKENPAKRFQRRQPKMTPERVIQTMDEQIRVGRRIANLKAMGVDEWEKMIVRTANNTICKNCGFAAICAAELNGESRNLYVGYDYEPKTRRVR